MSIVQDTLLTQRECWQEIADRIARTPRGELPPETPKRILLFGVGSSYHAAKLTAYSLIRDQYRTRVPVVACASHEIGLEVVPGKGDWAFAFSHRGATRDTVRAFEACARAGAFPVLVCGKEAQEGDVARLVLHTSPLEKVEPHTVAVTGAICAVTTLLLGAKSLEEWDALRSIGDPSLDYLRQVAGKGPSVMLGQWEGEWLAREGALKLMEMARLPVRAFGSEEFFHGPRFSVSAKDPIWHVSTAKDPRNDEIKAARLIAVTGASPMAYIPSLVELQWLSLAVALNREVDPDAPAPA